jgi:Zn-dependent alcohol dehydrogenase
MEATVAVVPKKGKEFEMKTVEVTEPKAHEVLIKIVAT